MIAEAQLYQFNAQGLQSFYLEMQLHLVLVMTGHHCCQDQKKQFAQTESKEFLITLVSYTADNSAVITNH